MKESSEYRARLKTLEEEQQRLEGKQAELLEKRRAELGRLAEKVGVLEFDDDALAGALLELKSAVENPAGDGTRTRLSWRRTSPNERQGQPKRRG